MDASESDLVVGAVFIHWFSLYLLRIEYILKIDSVFRSFYPRGLIVGVWNEEKMCIFQMYLYK